MVSIEIFSPVWWALIFCCFALVTSIAAIWRGYLARESKRFEAASVDLADPKTRYRLSLFLARRAITGDADIRDGQCIVVPVAPLDKGTALSAMLLQSYNEIAQTPNAGNGMLYYRHVGDGFDSFKLAGGLAVSDLRDAAFQIDVLREASDGA